MVVQQCKGQPCLDDGADGPEALDRDQEEAPCLGWHKLHQKPERHTGARNAEANEKPEGQQRLRVWGGKEGVREAVQGFLAGSCLVCRLFAEVQPKWVLLLGVAVECGCWRVQDG